MTSDQPTDDSHPPDQSEKQDPTARDTEDTAESSNPGSFKSDRSAPASSQGSRSSDVPPFSGGDASSTDNESMDTDPQQPSPHNSSDPDSQTPPQPESNRDKPNPPLSPQPDYPQSSQRPGHLATSPDTEPDTEWVYQYWSELHDVILSHPKRKAILETLCELPGYVLTSPQLADRVETTLSQRGLLENNDTEYTHHNLNQVLPEFERLGLIYRNQKFGHSGQYLILPITRLTNWIKNVPLQDYPSPDILPEGWGTSYTGGYITRQFPDTTPEAGLSLPAEALIYATLEEYAELTEPEVNVTLGNLEDVRANTETVDIDTIISHLELGTSVPDVDGPYVGDDGINDYCIFGSVSGITELYSRSDLQSRLTQQLASWLGCAQELYARTYARDDDQQPELSPPEYTIAMQQVHDQEPIPGARERFGMDVAVVPSDSDESSQTVYFGLYRRSGDNDPQRL